MPYANTFTTNQYPANTVKTSGSILLVGSLPSLGSEPTVKTLTVDSVISQGATSVDVTNSGGTFTIREGEILQFDTNNVTVASQTEIAGSGVTSLPIEAAPTGGLGSGDTAETWGLHKILSPTALPLSGESSDVDRKDYSFGLQGQNIKTRIDLSSSVEIINQTSDYAYQTIVLPASMDSRNIFSVIITGAEHAWGPCQISAVSDDNALEELSRPSFDINFQSPWARAGAFSQLSTNKQDKVNNVRRLSGLAKL